MIFQVAYLLPLDKKQQHTTVFRRVDELLTSESCFVIPSLTENSFKQTKKFMNKFIEFRMPHKFLTMDMSAITKQTNSTLLNFIHQLTCTVHGRRHKLFVAADEDGSNVK